MMPELDVKEIPGKNNGSAIAAALDTVMAEWGVVKEFCCRFVRDSGLNIVSTGKIVETNHYACIAHDLHPIVSGLPS
ncbi:hypothetical protein F443_20150 [Phytophthora nicotianae P1569]|uniref:Uncharacterized protein n=1 Tax=Phytophthora nicotianae P1569 TaxID=1317065 RepID=V9E3P6_PHYNI|nr:hypothetical protein F443_20150 [Phytophthora nicotianae P1569]